MSARLSCNPLSAYSCPTVTSPCLRRTFNLFSKKNRGWGFPYPCSYTTTDGSLLLRRLPFQQEWKPLPREGMGVGFYFTATFLPFAIYKPFCAGLPLSFRPSSVYQSPVFLSVVRSALPLDPSKNSELSIALIPVAVFRS